MSEEHLTSVFTRMRKRLQRLAMQFLPSEEDADDALQEAFCRLWPRADALANAEQAEAATTLTVRNLCIDEARRRNRRPTLELMPERDEADEPEPSPQEAMEREEQFALIEEILHQRLTPLQQQVLKMKEYEEMSYELNDWLELRLGPVVNINTHASLKTRYSLEGKGKKETHNLQHYNRLTVDLMGAVCIKGLGFYVKYSPCDVLDVDYAPCFKGISTGLILGF